MDPTRFASASGSDRDGAALVARVLASLRESLGAGPSPDIAFVFATPDLGPAVRRLGAVVQDALGARHVLGCTGAGVIGREGEHEGGHAFAVLAARLPGARVEPFALVMEDLEAAGDAGWEPPGAGDGADAPAFLLLADPYSFDPDPLLARFAHRYPGRPVIGGLASGGRSAASHVLWSDRTTRAEGAAGATLRGVDLRAVVSQGCRPVGRRFAVTGADGNRILSLAGRPAGDVLRATLDAMEPADLALARTSLHLGVVAHEAREDFRRGDFLIRNLLALVPADGSLVVGAEPRRGQTVQFQLRDAATAREDLEALLDAEIADAGGAPARAALVFSCGGRGSHMFGEPDHDLRVLRSRHGDIPVAGFFCNGEIGPVGPRSFVHGFTTSLALFR